MSRRASDAGSYQRQDENKKRQRGLVAFRHVRTERAGLLTVDDSQTIELFEERAAIIQHCGKRTKADAELSAFADAKARAGRLPSGRAVILPYAIRRTVSDTINKEFEAKTNGQI